MKIFSGVFGLIVLWLVLSFTLSNRQEVSVALWPLTDVWAAPLYLLGLLPLAFGLVLGGAWGWLGGMRHRLQARRLNKELVSLNDKISELQKAAIVQHAKAKPTRSFWKFNR